VHGIDFEEVSVQGELGDMPAWFVPGPQETWVIFVHGRLATREEALRVLPSVVDLGFPSLVITYRNDIGAPSAPDGMIRFGSVEWRDLEAAVLYARSHGAEEVVLYGYSMGGAIVTNFLYQSEEAELVRAVVLDAPILSFGELVDYQARRRGVPGLIAQAGKFAASLRYSFDWTATDYLRQVDRLGPPVLLFHGGSDSLVPVKTSELLASKRPDIVTYRRFDAAEHVRSWNVSRSEYELAVVSFLAPFALH
jgi:pimeloyl-ACP methyl ester carboxylesterase